MHWFGLARESRFIVGLCATVERSERQPTNLSKILTGYRFESPPRDWGRLSHCSKPTAFRRGRVLLN